MHPDIRWPNDLLVDGKKFGGILTEMRAEPDRIHYAVVGIGINVNQTKMPDRISPIPPPPCEWKPGKPHSRIELLMRLLRRFDHYYNLFLAHGAAPILDSSPRFPATSRGSACKSPPPPKPSPALPPAWSRAGYCACSATMAEESTPVLSGDVMEAS